MSVKEPLVHQGRLRSDLSDEDIRALDYILELQKQDNAKIDGYERLLFDLSDEQVAELRKTGEFTGERRLGLLAPYQTLAVGFALHGKNVLLGDSVGLGKTAEISGVVNYLRLQARKEGKPFRYMILTEKPAVIQTTNALMKFTGGYVDEVFGEQKHVKAFIDKYSDYGNVGDLGIVGIHTLLKNSLFHSWLRECQKLNGDKPFIDLLVIDESAVIMSSTTDYYKLGVKLRKDYCDRCICMNATPFERNLEAMYNQLNFLNDNLLPSKMAFLKQFVKFNYMTKRYDGKAGYHNPEMFKHMCSLSYFATTRKGLGATFEDCHTEILTYELSKYQKKLLVETSLPNMVFDCPTLLKSDYPFNIEYVPKLQAFDTLFNKYNFANTNNQMLIYCHHRGTQDLLKSYIEQRFGASVEIINGSDTKAEVRANKQAAFKSGKVDVLILNVLRGLNLQEANVMVFYSLPMTPSKLTQAEGRVTRELHVKNKDFYILTTLGKEHKRLKELRDKFIANNAHTMEELSLVAQLVIKAGSRL